MNSPEMEIDRLRDEVERLTKVNAELVGALEVMIGRYADDEALDSPLDQKARAALALAKGKP